MPAGLRQGLSQAQTVLPAARQDWQRYDCVELRRRNGLVQLECQLAGSFDFAHGQQRFHR